MTCKLNGVCASAVDFEVENGVIRSVSFTGGCNGNANGLSRLLPGMRAGDVIEKLKGVTCRQKATSCPDQLARALERYTAGE